jgi:uncharacterized protein YkwD
MACLQSAGSVNRAWLVAAVVVVALVGLPSVADNNSELCFRSKTNAERTSRGIKALKVDARIDKIARDHSDRMAEQGTIYHNDNLAKELPPFEYAGENVGMGPDCDEIHTAFMNSSSHKRAILERDFAYVGVGVTFDTMSQTVFVTLDFWTPRKPRSTLRPTPTSKPSCTCR